MMNVVFSVTGSLARIPAGATQWEDVSADCSVSLAQLKLRAHLPGGAKILADDISTAAFRHRQTGKKVQWSVNGQEAYFLHCRTQEDADQFASVIETVRGPASRRLSASSKVTTRSLTSLADSDAVSSTDNNSDERPLHRVGNFHPTNVVRRVSSVKRQSSYSVGGGAEGVSRPNNNEREDVARRLMAVEAKIDDVIRMQRRILDLIAANKRDFQPSPDRTPTREDNPLLTLAPPPEPRLPPVMNIVSAAPRPPTSSPGPPPPPPPTTAPGPPPPPAPSSSGPAPPRPPVGGGPPPPPPPPAASAPSAAGGSLAAQLQAAKLKRAGDAAGQDAAVDAVEKKPAKKQLDFASELQNRIMKRGNQ